jgi:hypothetical protein
MGLRKWLAERLAQDPLADLSEISEHDLRMNVVLATADVWERFKEADVYAGPDGKGWESPEAAMRFAVRDEDDAVDFRRRALPWFTAADLGATINQGLEAFAKVFIPVNLDRDKYWKAALDGSQEGPWGLALRSAFDLAWGANDDQFRKNVRRFPSNKAHRVALEVWLAATDRTASKPPYRPCQQFALGLDDQQGAGDDIRSHAAARRAPLGRDPTPGSNRDHHGSGQRPSRADHR